jgi:NhaA family Na+:H+ antiporter
MVVPACIYLLFNGGTAAVRGWGVPMATDIAFAVGVLALLGRRVPPALRILLLALAVIDDLGAIIVIAVFYSSGISLSGLVVALAGLVFIIVFQKLGVRREWAYLLPGLVVWGGTYAAGIHPTLAGPSTQLEAAKLGILCASAAAAVLGLTVGRFLLSPVSGPEAVRTDAEAESSTVA